MKTIHLSLPAVLLLASLYTLYSTLSTGEAQAWTGATNWSGLSALSAATSHHKTVISGNYLYSVGGKTNSGVTASIQYAPITSAPGQVPTLGSWVQYTTNPYQLPAARQAHAVVAYQGYLYAIGGKDRAGNTLNTIVRTQPNANGSLSGVWNSYTIPYYRRWIDAVVYNDFLYIVAGEDNSTMLKTVLYAKFNSDGSIPTCNYSISTCPNGWRISANMPQSLTDVGTTVYLAGSNTYLVVVGGSNTTTFQPAVYSIKINADGSLPTTSGSWQTLNSLPSPVDSPPVTDYNGYLYANGGSTGSTGIKYTFTSPIKPDGTIGSWAQFMLPAMSTTRESHDAVLWTNYLIALGGFNSSGNRTTSVETVDIESITVNCLVTTAAPYYTNQPISWTAFASGAIGTFTYLWSGEGVAGQVRNPATAFYTTPGDKSASVAVTSLTATKIATCPTITVTEQAPTPPPGAITSCSPQGTSPARASYLISTPKITSGKFSSQTGKCVAAIGSAVSPLNKAALPSFKLPSYSTLKQLYYTKSRSPKVNVTAPATQASLNSTQDTLFLVAGDLTITGNPPGSGTKVVFVEGKLTINPPSTTTPAYSYNYGTGTTGTIFIVKGDIDITPTTKRIDAVLISGETICSNRQTSGACEHVSGATDSQLQVNGTVVALNSTPGKGIQFTRDLLETLRGNTDPAEVINFDSKYLIILKQILSQPLSIFYEGTSLSASSLSNICKASWGECLADTTTGRKACDNQTGIQSRTCTPTEDGSRTQTCTGAQDCTRSCNITIRPSTRVCSSPTSSTGDQSFDLTYAVDDGSPPPPVNGTFYPRGTSYPADTSYSGGAVATYLSYPVGQHIAQFKGKDTKSGVTRESSPCSADSFYIPSCFLTGTGFKRIFVTSQTFNGNLGGLNGADSKCQAAADNAGLGRRLDNSPVIWKAWLSATGTNAKDRFASSIFKLVNGTPTTGTIATSMADLTDGKLAVGINKDERANTVTGNVWTGTFQTGLIDSANTCNNWTSSSSGSSGRRGSAGSTGSDWTSAGKSGCNNTFKLYCVEE